MLTDTVLKNWKSKNKTYKVSDRDGMYALPKTTGAIVFRLDYRLHGRREILTIGQYGRHYLTEDGKHVFPIGIAESQQVAVACAAVGSI